MVKLRFETDLSNSLKAGQDMSRVYKKVGDNVGQTVREMNSLEKAAARIIQQNLTPQERYNQKLETMAKAVKSGTVSMEQAQTTAGRLRQRLDDATRSGTRLFGPQMLGNIKSYFAGIVSISGAVAAFRSEMEAVKAEAERIAQSQLGAGAARDVLKRNIAGLPVAGRTQFERRADILAGQLSLPQAKVDVALAEAYSASGGDVKAAFGRVSAAAQFLKTQPDQIGAFSGSLGDISKGTGDQDAMRNLGFLIRVGAMSRVADAQKQAATIPSALAGAASFQASGEQAGALFAALSVASADLEGRKTGTGVIRSTEQLKTFFDEQVKGRKFQASAVDTFAERLGELRKSPTLASEFVDKASFEAKVKGPLQQFFLDPNSAIAREYESNLRAFGTPGEQRALARGTIAYLGQGRLAGTAAVERTIAAHTEQFRLGRGAELTQQSREEIVERVRQITGLWSFINRAGIAARTGATMSPSEAISELETALTIERRNRQPWSAGLDPELVQNTREMIGKLEAIRDEVKGSKTPRPSGRQE